MQEAKSRIEQVIDLCTEGKFTGVLRVDSAVAQGEVQFFSGIRDEVRFGISTGAEALARMIQAPSPRCEAIPSLPNPRGGFKKGLSPQGPLSEMRGMDLMHYCETYALTCTLELHALGRKARALYRIGELTSIELIDGAPGGDAIIADMLQAVEGTYEFTLPPFELPEAFRSVSQRPAKPQDWLQNLVGGDGAARPASSAPPAVAARSLVDPARTSADAEAQRAVDERARVLAAEAEAQRRAAEADAKRKADAARAAAVARPAEAARAAAARKAEADASRRAEEERAARAAREAEAAEAARAAEAEAHRAAQAELARAAEAEIARAAEAEAARTAQAEAARALEAAAAEKAEAEQKAALSAAAERTASETADKATAAAASASLAAGSKTKGKAASEGKRPSSPAAAAAAKKGLRKDASTSDRSPPKVSGPSLTIVLVVVILLVVFLLIMRMR
jgi:hypothetical protein